MATGGGKTKTKPTSPATRRTAADIETDTGGGLTPLAYMLRLLRDEDAPGDERRWAAQHAAPYIHPKLTAIEHSGEVAGTFLRGAQSIWRKIESSVVNLDLPVIFTGHSKGGAEASLCAGLMAARSRRPAALVTFGCPYVTLSKRLERWLADTPITHYVMRGDPVPRLPLIGGCLGFYKRPGEDSQLGDDRRISFSSHKIGRYEAAVTSAGF